MPLFALGTYQLPPSSIKASVFAFLQAGGRHIDTAQFYDNEQAVGQAVRDAVGQGLVKRGDVFITTKVYRGFDELDELEANVSGSLERIGLGQSFSLVLCQSELLADDARPMLRDGNRLHRPLSHPLAVDGEGTEADNMEEPLFDCGEGW